MSTSPSIAAVQDYTTRPPTQRDTRNLSQRFRDSHEEAVSAGITGPVVLLATFLSSTTALMYRGCRYAYRRVRGLV